jgi:hypothetical protein
MRLNVELATPADDAGIRRLLRDNPIEGEVRVTLEREPSARLAAAVEGEPHHTVVARDPSTGAILGMGSRAVWNAFVDGEPCRLGYLAQLRVDRRIRGRAHLLAEGYRLLDERRGADELPFDVTAIVADNRIARRLLEADVAGLPRYRELAALSTLVLPVGRPRRTTAGIALERGTAARLPEAAACIARHRRRHQAAPFSTAAELASPEKSRGLAPGDFHIATAAGEVVGCLALWDQRTFKQVVVRGYGPRLARLRAVSSLFRLDRLPRWLGVPRLPAPGAPLPHAYLSHLAVDGDDPATFRALVEAAHVDAGERGLSTLVLTLAAAHSWLPWLRRRFRPREYASVLYTVAWDRGASPGDASRAGADPAALDRALLPHVEAARL